MLLDSAIPSDQKSQDSWRSLPAPATGGAVATVGGGGGGEADVNNAYNSRIIEIIGQINTDDGLLAETSPLPQNRR